MRGMKIYGAEGVASTGSIFVPSAFFQVPVNFPEASTNGDVLITHKKKLVVCVPTLLKDFRLGPFVWIRIRRI